jgi:hypothetical protein
VYFVQFMENLGVCSYYRDELSVSLCVFIFRFNDKSWRLMSYKMEEW